MTAEVNRAWERYLQFLELSEKAREAYYRALDAERDAYIKYQTVRFAIKPAPAGGTTT
jgi:hypothetical protein